MHSLINAVHRVTVLQALHRTPCLTWPSHQRHATTPRPIVTLAATHAPQADEKEPAKRKVTRKHDVKQQSGAATRAPSNATKRPGAGRKKQSSGKSRSSSNSSNQEVGGESAISTDKGATKQAGKKKTSRTKNQQQRKKPPPPPAASAAAGTAANQQAQKKKRPKKKKKKAVAQVVTYSPAELAAAQQASLVAEKSRGQHADAAAAADDDPNTHTLSATSTSDTQHPSAPPFVFDTRQPPPPPVIITTPRPRAPPRALPVADALAALGIDPNPTLAALGIDHNPTVASVGQTTTVVGQPTTAVGQPTTVVGESSNAAPPPGRPPVTTAHVEQLAALLQHWGLGLQLLKTLVQERPSLLRVDTQARVQTQINTIATALGAPSKASTAAVRTLLQATAHDGWRSLPTASQVHATVDMLRTTLGYSLHTIAKMATAQSNLLCTPVRTLTRHYEYLAGTLAGVSAPTTTRKASTRAGQHPNTSANHVKLLHTAIRRNPALLVLDDLSMRRAWLRGVLTTRCDLSGDAVASQVLVGCPEALALSRARVQGVVAVLVRVLGATRAGELLTLAPRILCMSQEELVHRMQLLQRSQVPMAATLHAPLLLTASTQRVAPRLAFLRTRRPQLLRRADVLQQCLQCSDVEFVEGYAEGLLEEYVVFQVQWASMGGGENSSSGGGAGSGSGGRSRSSMGLTRGAA